MILQDLFRENNYEDIEDDADGVKTGLYMNYFYDDDLKPQELKGIYISCNKDELFIVLSCKGENVRNLCSKWDEMIRNFMIFGAEDKAILDKMKYNVVQLVIFNDDIEDRSEELSLNISRKIFLKGEIDQNGNIILDNDEELEIPFYMIKADPLQVNNDMKEQLKRSIPTDNSLDFMTVERKKANKNNYSFMPSEYDCIKRWLREDEDYEY